MDRSRRNRSHADLQRLLKEIIRVDSMLEGTVSIVVLTDIGVAGDGIVVEE